MCKVVLFSLLSLVAAVAVQAKDSVFELAGFPAKVCYGAEESLEKGNDCELAVVLVHGWGGGARAGGNSSTLRSAATKKGVKAPYVVQPLFPRRSVLEKAKIEVEGRAVWNASLENKDLKQLTFYVFPGIGHEGAKAYANPDLQKFIFGK